ncbi:MAG: efflux RND transporter periplasmic adaptor subunit [Enterobacteriaceae bacterium]
MNAEQQQLAILDTEYQQLQAQLQQSEAALALAQKALSDTRILAPVSGIIGNRSLQEGKFVNAGAGVLVIVPTDDIWLVANYKETQLTKVQPGQSVAIKLDMFPDHAITGKVLSLAPATGARFSLLPPDNATGNFVKVVQRVPVKIAVQIPQELQGRIVPGLSAEVSINTRSSVM